MHLYKDCGDLPIHNFDMINKTGDQRYLVVGFDGYKKIKTPKGANERWQAIKKEWLNLVDDNEMAYYHNLVSECIWLETSHNMIKYILENIYKRGMSPLTFRAYAKGLEEWGAKWNFKNDKLTEMERQLKLHRIASNRVSLKLDELRNYKEKNRIKNEGYSLEKQAIYLEKAGELNYSIDTKTTSVRKWVELNKMATERQSQLKKSHGK